MNWLHCNKCGVHKTQNSTVEFFCGLCSHVLCKNCSVAKNCPIDKRPFNGIAINNSMQPKMQSYFEDPNKILESWSKCIRFQFEQRNSCEALIIEERRKLSNELKLLQKAKGVMMKANEKEKKRNDKMKAYLGYLQKHSCPPEELHSMSRASTSTASLNVSSALGESGVDLEFDELDNSN